MHFDYKVGSKVLRPLVRTRPLAAGIGALVLGTTVPAVSGETAITCTNLSSGASFQIKIDYDRSTVDTNPARISDREISWRDPQPPAAISSMIAASWSIEAAIAELNFATFASRSAPPSAPRKSEQW